MGRLVRRSLVLIFHAFATIYLLTWVMQYDITNSWITFSGFISLLLLLLFFLALHVISFFYFIKSRPKE